MNNLLIGLIPYGASAALLNALDTPFVVNVIASTGFAILAVVVIKMWGPIT